jgi:hypothetical protein
LAAVVGATVTALSAATAAQGQVAAYLDHDGLTAEIRSLVDGSNAASLRSLATSYEGREIWLVEIGSPDGPPLEDRPGVLVVGNLEGDHVVGSQLVLEMIRFLLGDGEAAGSALADHVFYLIPRANPDGAEAMFGGVLADNGRNRRPWDDDNDGRIDEDPPEDLNGDGLVTLMRVPDPLGAYVPDDTDPRLMVEADPRRGSAGAYSIYWEGLDSDGDGFFNEDGRGGVDINRNFQHEYPYYTVAAGPHMVSEVESRALMDFVIGHRNIALILTFGNSDNLVTAPDSQGRLGPTTTLSLLEFADASNSEAFDVGIFSAASPVGGLDLRGVQPGADNEPDSGRRPAVTVDGEDLAYFRAVSDAYREITGIERVGVNRPAAGAFFQYGYFQFGVSSFSTQGWGLPDRPEADEAEDADVESADPDAPEAEILRALEGAGIDAFVDWVPFTHPDLGEVEIGGFRPYAATNPPADRIPELGRLHGEFLLDVAEKLPRVRIVGTEVESHGGGLFTVSAEVENSGFFPSAFRHGVVAGSVDPVTVRIDIPREDLVTGNALTSQISTLPGSGSRERFSWLIRGTAGNSVQIRVRAQKGGTDAASVTLGGGGG